VARWAFLGPEGTFTEEALLSLGEPGVEPVACATIADVFEAVESADCASGIVPRHTKRVWFPL
jgi:chorismate mutase/prephenate dehydratase